MTTERSSHRRTPSLQDSILHTLFPHHHAEAPPPHPQSRRISVTKASSITVVLSGGVSLAKTSSTMYYSRLPLPLVRIPCIFELVDGNLTLRYRGSTRIMLRNKSSSPSQRTPVFAHSILSISAISYKPRALWFQVLFSEEQKKRYYFHCNTEQEALEWVLVLKQELWNQVLVCQTLFVVLKREGHADRGEALFAQMLNLVHVIFHNRDHFQVAKIHRLYAEWLATQLGRETDSATEFALSTAMQARCEHNLYF